MNFQTVKGSPVGAIGQGTWYLGESDYTYQSELSALKTGVERGMNLIDTAEMYGEGAAEVLVGDAIQGFDRESLYLVSKVYPWNAGRNNIRLSCENSLRRMKTDYLDLYLLHWKGDIPFRETIECMEELKQQGKIRNWGVSNLDTADMKKLLELPDGRNCLTDQVLYHMGSRGVEYDLLPYLRENQISVMAYCPLAQGGRLRRGLLSSPTVQNIAFSHNVTPGQVLLAFLTAQEGVMPIPRTGNPQHTEENAAAMELVLSQRELALINQAFPAPRRKMPLDMQ